MNNKKGKTKICKILTVDDELGIDSFFYEFFTLRNFEVLTASNGRDALRLVQKEQPKIVLLDVKMRGMDGIETLKRIREINKEAIIIMVTGVKDDETIKAALSLGANDYITKPLSLEYLEKVVLLKFLEYTVKDVKKRTEDLLR